MAEGLERLRRMTSGENTVSVDLSIAVPNCAANLEKPVARRTVEIPSAPADPFPWRRVAESNGRDAVTVADPRPGGLGRGSIDMNEIPCPNECGYGMDASPPTSLSIISGFPPGAVRVIDSVSPATVFRRELALDIAVEREVSSRTSDEDDTAGPTRKKLRLSKDQSTLLEECFREHSTLNPKHKNALAKKLNLRPRQVEVWFQNRRARTKLKQTEVDCEALKRCCENLTEENRRLERELQELRALKVSPPCVISNDLYMQPLAAATLTMCPACERIATMENTASRTLTFSKPRRLPHFTRQSAAC